MKLLLLFNIVELLLLTYVVFSSEIKGIRTKMKIKKEVAAVTSLTEKKMKDDLDLERDKDFVSIDEYMKYLKDVIEKFDKSRSKKIAYNTRQRLLNETIQIIPVFDKYIGIDYFYDPEDTTFKNMSDRELMELLESIYNDFTHDNLESFNSIISVVLRLRDGK